MSFQKSRRLEKRNFWRAVFIWTIGLTLPCYILAFFVYAFAAPQVERINPTDDATATWTPIDPNAILTQLVLTNPAPTVSPIFASNTPFDDFSTSIPDFSTSVFVTATTAPTRFITLTPSVTPQATNTVPPTIAQPTIAPTDAPPILLPPTNTANP